MDRIITYGDAIREATEQEMAQDPNVILLGLGANDFTRIFGTTRGLVERFGNERVFDTPLAEDAMTGIAIGAALAGLRPIHVHIRMDFLLLAVNQLINIAAKSRYMSGGSVAVPLVVRAIIGRSWGQGAQHSQALQSLFMHIPGLKVVAPTTPYDAKGCLIQSIRDNNPIIFIEHRMLHPQLGHVPEGSYSVPLGQSRVLAEGSDVTLVGISHTVVECLRARHSLERIGIDAEVIDPVTLSPLDTETIANSVRKTGKLVVADTGWLSCGASAEVVTRIAERLQGEKQFTFRRVGFASVPCPTTKNLENLFYPNSHTIGVAACALMGGGVSAPLPEIVEGNEIAEFRGPF